MDQDKAILSVVLSPSVSNVLSKVAPELNPLLSQFTKEEENVILPVSVVKNFAARKYGGQTEAESVQSFVADLTGQMEQTTTVPPETEAIDQDLA
jgi:Tfp pilus assembly protein PilP